MQYFANMTFNRILIYLAATHSSHVVCSVINVNCSGGMHQYSLLPSFRTERTLFDYFRRSFKSSSAEEFQK